METTATVSKGTVDAKTRELNALAKAAAAKDMAAKAEAPKPVVKGKANNKPTKGLREVTKPATKAPKDVAKAAPKVVKPKLSEFIDTLIAKCGKWEDLIADAQKFCTDNGLRSKITQGSFKTQIHWRRNIQNQPEYAADKVLTEKGIEKVSTKSKSKK